MQQLSGQDAMFLSAELDGLPQHVGGVSIYDQSTATNGVVRFKEILGHLKSRVHLSPIFTHKLLEVPMGLDISKRASTGPGVRLDCLHVPRTNLLPC